MQAVIPRPDIAPLLQAGFIAVAGDVDDPAPEVHELIYNLKNASMLPFVIITDANGQFLDGSSGAVDPAKLKGLLEAAAQSGSS